LLLLLHTLKQFTKLKNMDTKKKKILLFAEEKLWVANSCNEMKEMVPGLTKKKVLEKVSTFISNC
jgi:hypothetical protein